MWDILVYIPSLKNRFKICGGIHYWSCFVQISSGQGYLFEWPYLYINRYFSLFRLPLPWFLFTLVFQKPVPVSAEGMVCSIVLLFLMLVAVFMSILLFKWKMTKIMGFSMFVFYFIFVIITLGFEYDFWTCPI